ncbi:NUA3 [Candida oxycetoniae]|uniref:uS12 prolyl 3,4-dihydroxylase n=1 Tax=Candida oxycetoniae TaxID=497107 RepID=A0AAI9T211_9ASCO|nr:NUA3 [Candida oxycetoniae]KAI3406630.2 NUA3 [Candida oxycetoniae]
MVEKRLAEQDEVETCFLKKANTTFTKEDIRSFFNEQIWRSEFQDKVQKSIANSGPYNWGTIKELMDDTLLRQVRKEVLSEIAFTKKETDIYKVYQSGDLANLSGLDWDDLSRLPSLHKLRAAIYSQEFRDVISKVTGCGKLSGLKTDMSINSYTKGCHLLTHDDVIGSRRVSFILYLPEPDKVWKPEYGGALRLFPSVVPNVPHTDYECKLVPQFNQIAFFTVQPGLSFHDVEEVRVDKHRLSIQGWFHIPQKGEDGFIEGEQEKTESMSTLNQLQSKELQEFDAPKCTRKDLPREELSMLEPSKPLTEAETQFLKKYLNPIFLEQEVYKKLADRFIKESYLEVQSILNDSFASTLKESLRDVEINEPTPQRSTDVKAPWKIAVPPHKQRFMYIEHTSNDVNNNNNNNNTVEKSPASIADSKLCELAKFLASVEFKRWLRIVTDLIPTSENVLVRRFRPGNDFILATTTEPQVARSPEEENVLLEATLNLTPTASNPKNWESGEFGGYELCMVQPSSDDGLEQDDPAIYRSNKEGDEDSVLHTNQCKWNSLILMVRDPSVLKFIKYVSINAKGSRWDIDCSWNVRSMGDEEDD